MTTLYHNPRCRKSREALQILQQANEPVEIVLYLKNSLSKEELKDILLKLEITAIALIRKNEAVWKENYKNKSLTEDELITAMVNNPKLIERPIAIKNGKAIIGRPPQEVLKVL
jgi:arsenate reductase